MYARVPDLAGERMAAGTPGPGAYDVARPAAGAPGSPADASAPARSPGPTLKGREAWAGSGPPAPREALARTRGVRQRRRRASSLGRTGVHHGRASLEPEGRRPRLDPWARGVPRGRGRGRGGGGVRIRRRPPTRSVPFAKEGRDVRRQARARRRVVPPGRARPSPARGSTTTCTFRRRRATAGRRSPSARSWLLAKTWIRRRATRRVRASTTASTAKTTWRFSPASAAA